MAFRAKAVPVVATVLVTGLLVAAAFTLDALQDQNRSDLLKRFGSSSDSNAAVSAAIFGTSAISNGRDLTEDLGGDEVPDRAADERVAQGAAPYAFVVDAQGELLAASKDTPPSAIEGDPALPALIEGALSEQGFALSDVLPREDGPSVAQYAVGFEAEDGSRRVYVSGVDPEALNTFQGGYLKQTDDLGDATSLLMDSNGVVLATTSPDDQALGETSELAQTVDDAVGEPVEFEDTLVSATPVEGTTWRAVATAPSDAILASVQGGNKLFPWLLYAAIVVASYTAIALLHRALSQGANTSEMNRQLAVSKASLEASNAGLERANDLLGSQAKELKRSNLELEQFASVASHDLSEPLRKVQMFSKQLRETEGEHLTDEGNEYLDRMVGAAERMETLIQDLLQFSRVSTRTTPFVPVNLEQVFHDVESDLEGTLAASSGRIEIGDLPRVEADPLQMRQLAQNLLANALKFAREGVPPVVTVEGEIVGPNALLVVSDNGIGFDQRYAERIFRVFERLHGRSTYAGTGIGLALCRKIAERHGGEIEAEGKLGEGATFRVTLPLSQPASPRNTSRNGDGTATPRGTRVARRVR